jgi:hypothetical protein
MENNKYTIREAINAVHEAVEKANAMPLTAIQREAVNKESRRILTVLSDYVSISENHEYDAIRVGKIELDNLLAKLVTATTKTRGDQIREDFDAIKTAGADLLDFFSTLPYRVSNKLDAELERDVTSAVKDTVRETGAKAKRIFGNVKSAVKERMQ